MDARGLFDGFLDLIFPRRCVGCRAPGAWLCAGCAAQLEELPALRCPRCGAPGAGVACPECRGRELAFSHAAAAFAYTGPARALVTACKFRALRSIAVEMTALAAPAFCAAFGAATPAAGAPRAVLAGASPAAASPSARDQVDLVTWVPGHRDRSLERGFNQAELLARGLSRAAGVPCAALLRRTRHGVRQSGLDRVARTANVRDAFALREDASRVLRNLKRVVVVDDVYTTGETLNHCARVLRHAGIDPLVFTFARTVRAHPSRNTSNRPAPPREATPSRASLHTATDKERCR